MFDNFFTNLFHYFFTYRYRRIIYIFLLLSFLIIFVLRIALNIHNFCGIVFNPNGKLFEYPFLSALEKGSSFEQILVSPLMKSVEHFKHGVPHSFIIMTLVSLPHLFHEAWRQLLTVWIIHHIVEDDFNVFIELFLHQNRQVNN